MATASWSDVIYSSFGPNGEFSHTGSRSATSYPQGNPPADHDLANQFTVGQGPDYYFSSLSIEITHWSLQEDFDVLLLGNTQGLNLYGYTTDLPDETNIIEAFHMSVVGPYEDFSLLTLNSTTHPLLSADEKYWVFLSTRDGNPRVMWWGGEKIETVFFAERDNDELWRTATSDRGPALAYSISGDAVPEPSTFILLGMGLSSMGYLPRLRKGLREKAT